MTSATFTTEFRHEYEAERERWLRKRFLSYCGVVIALSTTVLFIQFLAIMLGSTGGRGLAAWLPLALGAALTLLYVGAYIHGYRHLLTRTQALAVVFWLIVINGSVSLISSPFVVRAQIDQTIQDTIEARDRQIEADRRSRQTNPLADPAPQTKTPNDIKVRTGTGPIRIDLDGNDAEELLNDPKKRETMIAQAVILNNGLVAIFFSHLFACLFLPWTPRESIRPIIPLLILSALLNLYYIRLFPVGAAIAIFTSPLVAVPGMGICVWRNSRFRERFNIRMLKGRYGEIKQELASARQIHESLFPQPITTGPVRFEYRYEPMRQIGGDYLFVKQAQLEGKPLPIMHMAIVDVTGHGIGAALTVNRLYGEIARRFGENSNASPGEILTGLNDYLHHSLATHSVYATAVCLRFDPNTGSLAWASAGHPPAFLRTVDGKIDRLDSTTLVLGACRGDDFHHNEQATRFHPGDMLLLYTDGAIETRNAQGRMLGLRGLESLIASVHPDETGGYASAVLRGVDEHRFGPAQDDTLIVEVWRPLKID